MLFPQVVLAIIILLIFMVEFALKARNFIHSASEFAGLFTLANQPPFFLLPFCSYSFYALRNNGCDTFELTWTKLIFWNKFSLNKIWIPTIHPKKSEKVLLQLLHAFPFGLVETTLLLYVQHLQSFSHCTYQPSSGVCTQQPFWNFISEHFIQSIVLIPFFMLRGLSPIK